MYGIKEDELVYLTPEERKNLLKLVLLEIEDNDPSSFTFKGDETKKQTHYDVRNDLIYDAVHLARKMDYKAGFVIHTPVTEIIEKGWDERWGVVAYIELPTGQVSWHIESPDIKYDGHTYKDKHDRILAYTKEEK